jgi:hypothetical protein
MIRNALNSGTELSADALAAIRAMDARTQLKPSWLPASPIAWEEDDEDEDDDDFIDDDEELDLGEDDEEFLGDDDDEEGLDDEEGADEEEA